MSLKFETEDNSAIPDGMSISIYNELMKVFQTDITNKKADMPTVEDAFKKLSFAIAAGVIKHIKDNMVIKGIKTIGKIEAAVNGETNDQIAGGHHHHLNQVKITCVQTDVEFTQNNGDGKGLVE